MSKRWYSTTKVNVREEDERVNHTDKLTIKVWSQMFVSDKGTTQNLPHQIGVATAESVRWLRYAINQLAISNFQKDCRVSQAHWMVYRNEAIREYVKQSIKDKKPEQTNGKTNNENEIKVKQQITTIKDKLQAMLKGLTSQGQVIKVSNKTRATHNPEIPKYFRGLVKSNQIGEKKTWGHIEVGYEAFRQKLCLPRVIIHESAHKYTSANDGPDHGGGYWKADFSDYLAGDKMKYDQCQSNADSHALFVWALNAGQNKVPEIPKEFETVLERKWKGG